MGLCIDYYVVQPCAWRGFDSDPALGGLIHHEIAGLDPSVTFPYARLRVFPGKIDAADQNHFTINFESQGKSRIIDGWLHDKGWPPLQGPGIYGSWLELRLRP
jgi:hypothetical protein